MDVFRIGLTRREADEVRSMGCALLFGRYMTSLTALPSAKSGVVMLVECREASYDTQDRLLEPATIAYMVMRNGEEIDYQGFNPSPYKPIRSLTDRWQRKQLFRMMIKSLKRALAQ